MTRSSHSSPAAVVKASIEAASIDTREPKRDAHLKSPDFLDVERHPTITFVSKTIESAGAGRWNVRAGAEAATGWSNPEVIPTVAAGRNLGWSPRSPAGAAGRSLLELIHAQAPSTRRSAERGRR